MNHRILFVLVFLTAAAAAQDIPTLTLSTRVVAVAAVVRAKDGHPVGGLAREDFELREDGKPQEIRYFFQGSTTRSSRRPTGCLARSEAGAPWCC